MFARLSVGLQLFAIAGTRMAMCCKCVRLILCPYIFLLVLLCRLGEMKHPNAISQSHRDCLQHLSIHSNILVWFGFVGCQFRFFALRPTPRRLCEVFCILQNLQMYEVPGRAWDGKASGAM